MPTSSQPNSSANKLPTTPAQKALFGLWSGGAAAAADPLTQARRFACLMLFSAPPLQLEHSGKQPTRQLHRTCDIKVLEQQMRSQPFAHVLPELFRGVQCFTMSLLQLQKGTMTPLVTLDAGAAEWALQALRSKVDILWPADATDPTTQALRFAAHHLLSREAGGALRLATDLSHLGGEMVSQPFRSALTAGLGELFAGSSFFNTTVLKGRPNLLMLDFAALLDATPTQAPVRTAVGTGKGAALQCTASRSLYTRPNRSIWDCKSGSTPVGPSSSHRSRFLPRCRHRCQRHPRPHPHQAAQLLNLSQHHR